MEREDLEGGMVRAYKLIRETQGYDSKVTKALADVRVMLLDYLFEHEDIGVAEITRYQVILSSLDDLACDFAELAESEDFDDGESGEDSAISN